MSSTRNSTFIYINTRHMSSTRNSTFIYINITFGACVYTHAIEYKAIQVILHYMCTVLV